MSYHIFISFKEIRRVSRQYDHSYSCSVKKKHITFTDYRITYINSRTINHPISGSPERRGVFRRTPITLFPKQHFEKHFNCNEPDHFCYALFMTGCSQGIVLIYPSPRVQVCKSAYNLVWTSIPSPPPSGWPCIPVTPALSQKTYLMSTRSCTQTVWTFVKTMRIL